jgi:hypothetical protein
LRGKSIGEAQRSRLEAPYNPLPGPKVLSPKEGACSVIRIRIPWLFDVLRAIDGIDSVTVGHTIKEDWLFLFQAKNQLEAMFAQGLYAAHLRVSREHAGDFYNSISQILGDGSDNERALTELEVWSLKFRKDAFRPIFLSEVSTFPSFLVTEREGYDINMLIDDGKKLFPIALAIKAPDSVRDAMEAGKAIAFQLPTAAGFHIFRVVESVLKRYWDHVAKASRPKLETIGNYATELEKAKVGDLKIIESLKQLAKLHRNPLIHPEVILDVGEEIEILGISRSVVGAMLKTLPDVPTTTSASST